MRLSTKALRVEAAFQAMASPWARLVLRMPPSIGASLDRLGRLEGEVVGVEAEAELRRRRPGPPKPVTPRAIAAKTTAIVDQPAAGRPDRPAGAEPPLVAEGPEIPLLAVERQRRGEHHRERRREDVERQGPEHRGGDERQEPAEREVPPVQERTRPGPAPPGQIIEAGASADPFEGRAA